MEIQDATDTTCARSTNTSILLTRGSNCFHSGRYREAANEFSSAASATGITTNATSTPHKDPATTCSTFNDDDTDVQVSLLAVQADASLCQFRAYLETSKSSSAYKKSNANPDVDLGSETFEEVNVLQKAIHDNEIYMEALTVRISSLVGKDQECDGRTFEKSTEASVSASVLNETPIGTNNVGTSTGSSLSLLIDKQRLELSTAVLMATITRSWLHMHIQSNSPSDIDDDQDAHINGEFRDNPSNILIWKQRQGIFLAGCPFTSQNPNDFMNIRTMISTSTLTSTSTMPTMPIAIQMEAMNILQRVMEEIKQSRSMLSLYNVQLKRLELTLRNIQHVLNVVGLFTGAHNVTASNTLLYTETELETETEKDTSDQDIFLEEDIINNNSNQQQENDKTSNRKQTGTDATGGTSNGKRGKKRRRSTSDDEEGGKTNRMIDPEQDRSKLALQEHLVQALYHHHHYIRNVLDAKSPCTDTDINAGRGAKKKRNVNGTLASTDKKDHRYQRDQCMQQALNIEGQGFAGKLNVFFQAIELLSEHYLPARISSQVQSSPPYSHSSSYSMKESTIVSKLNTYSSTSATAAGLLGCIQAHDREPTKAVVSFERALQHLMSDPDSRVTNRCQAYRETVSNIGHCFEMLGDTESALELLLFWMDDENDNVAVGSEKVRDHAHPVRYNISTEILGGIGGMGNQSQFMTGVLYRLFFAATVEEDWDTCKMALARLQIYSEEHALIPMADAFVKLETVEKGMISRKGPEEQTMLRGVESHKSTASKHMVNGTSPFQKEEHITNQLIKNDSDMTKIGLLIYEADQIVSQILMDNSRKKSIGAKETTGGTRNNEIPYSDNGRLVLSNLSEARQTWNNVMSSTLSKDNEDMRAIDGCIWNNQGIANMMNGRSAEAMHCFLNAMKIFERNENKSHTIGSKVAHTAGTCASSYVLSIFNLSLALWMQGSKVEASGLYLKQRGHIKRLSSLKQSDLDRAITDYDADAKEDVTCQKQVLALEISTLRYIMNIEARNHH